MRISDWSSDVCSSDLPPPRRAGAQAGEQPALDGQPAAVFLQPEAPVLQQRQHYREHAQQDRESEQRGQDRQRVVAEGEVGAAAEGLSGGGDTEGGGVRKEWVRTCDSRETTDRYTKD